ncbi:Ig-like domain-containing protein [Ruminococcus sp. 210702-SL.1.03]|uniref:Ig-like domain-containing protein n=1 Tax=Ruminococcus sp. 210702-SL.1.03 TaxID=2883233 RepID=UPI001D084278|nr:Ig-like domain-containing protein [Ruminococcus sp. 210702-SL.1.03]MCB6615244.1 Ig-like domain-containing protein [Ruminococcus sp. 210702-SL.1.03]
MSYSAKTTASRAAAGTMAAIFAMSAFSFDQAFISASAESLAAYTVKFTNSNGDLQDVDGVKVTLTSAADPNVKAESTSEDGKAVFENFAESGAEYNGTFDFTGVYGFKELESSTITVDGDSWSAVIEALPKYTVSGKVELKDLDKLDNSVSPLMSYWGYGHGNADEPEKVTIGNDGGYSYEVYGGYDYSLSVSAGKEYEFKTVVKNVSADTENDDYTLEFATYSLKRAVNGTGGGITFDLKDDKGEYQPIEEDDIADDTISVNAASRVRVNVNADDTYAIKSLKIGGSEIADAEGKSEYTAELSGICDNTEIEVEFQKKIYTVTYVIGENGKLLKQESDDAASGWVEIKSGDKSEEAGSSVTLKAEAGSNYHIDEFKVDGADRISADDRAEKNSPKTFEHKIDKIKNNVTVEVSFVIDEFDIAIDNGEGGSVNGSTAASTLTVDYDASPVLEITPDSGKHIASVTKKYTEIVHNDETGTDEENAIEEPLEYTENDKSSNGYTLTLENVTYDFTVEVRYADDETKTEAEIPAGVSSNLEELVKKGRKDEADNTYYLPADENNRAKFSYSRDDSDDEVYGIAVNKKLSDRNSKDVTIESGTEIKTISLYYDHQWHNYELAKPIKIVYDGDAPTIEARREPDNDWTSEQNVTITATITDNAGGSGVKPESVTIKGNGENDIVEPMTPDGDKWTFVTSDEQDKTYTITATDYTGNSNSKNVTVGIDRKAPTIDVASVTSVNANDSIAYCDDFIQSSEAVTINVKASDAEPSSGIKEIALTAELVGGSDNGTEIAIGTVDYNESAAFTVEPKLFDKYNYDHCNFYAVAQDNAGNVCKNTLLEFENSGKTYTNFIISSNSTLSVGIKPNSAEKWYNDKETGFTFCTFSWKDDKFYIEEVSIDINNTPIKGKVGNTENEKWDKFLKDFNTACKENERGEHHELTLSADALVNSGCLKDGENTVTIRVKNVVSDTEKVASYTFWIDKTKPVIEDINIAPNENTIKKAINALSFGYFFNNTVDVTVSVKDENASSGIKYVKMTYTDTKGKSIEKTAGVNDEGVAVFTLPEEQIKDEKVYLNSGLTFVAYDNVENESEQLAPENGDLMIENIKPEITVDLPEAYGNANENTDKGGNWYNSDVEMKTTVKDKNSGINSVNVELFKGKADDNAKAFKAKEYAEANGKVAKVEKSYTENIAKTDEDGEYTFKVKALDNAGNESVSTHTVYKDTKPAEITDFEFITNGYKDGYEDGHTPFNGVIPTLYGYYFKEDATVRIKAEDSGSGVNFIYYKLENINDKDHPEGGSAPANKDGYIDITVKAGFKGQISAYATDNAGNNEVNYKTPNGTVVETQQQHENEGAHIAISRPSPVSTTNSGDPLYAGSVPVTITVSDMNSGIRDINCTINGSQIGTSIPNSIGEAEYGGWKVLESQDNLIYKMEKTVTVSENINNIPVVVEFTDRCGNTSHSEDSFSIDTTKPSIEITWDNTQPDSDNKDFYNKNRTATITVTDRNFSGSDLVLNISNTDYSVPSAGSWTSSGEGDSMKHTTTVTFSADGDYKFSAYCFDRAGNRSNEAKTPDFTVDKTLPVISVSYSSSDEDATDCFSADRTATITVTEHNFQESRVSITGTATNGGAKVKFPEASKWKQSGDKYTATIKYTDEALYSFAISVKDKAGNESAKYEKDSFTIDKTAPQIVFTGVKDKSANNGEVAPIITMTDTNYDDSTVQISLSGANNGEVEYPGNFGKTKGGQVYTFENFEKKKEIDDIYTLSVSVTDLAGNTASGAISFSANRFGSVYTIDDSTKEILGKYINEERNVIVKETNVDELVDSSINVKVIKNGSPSDLAKDSGYTLGHEGGNGEWSVYTYTVKASQFKNDGSYGVSIFSNDKADNENDTAEEKNNAEIAFGIDKTAPIIVPVDIKSDETYSDEVKNVKIEISDNLVLDTAEVMLNGKKIDCDIQGDTFDLKVPESTKRQNISITATDSAGNKAQMKISNFLVSSNAFVRWYNNTPLFIGTIIGAIVLIAAIVMLFVFFRKKKL